MIAICPAGPPKEMKPSLTQKRNASENETLRSSAALFSLTGATATASLFIAIALAFSLLGHSAEHRIQSIEYQAALMKQFAVVFE
jgi:hypothetical protein